MKLATSILITIALSLGVACDDKKDGDKKTEEKKTETKDGKTVTTTKVEEKKTEVKEEPAKAEPEAGGGGGDKIGIPECDEYIEKYSKCISDKVPEAGRAAMKDAMDATVKAWKEAAASGAKDGLATGCKGALDAAKQATASMGCEW
ncbi:MAG TPA: hypothetical protein VG755_18085 [Nannocystaceae bacterium]|nr:hypothetical protein [Nannocystaceae bacterium]